MSRNYKPKIIAYVSATTAFLVTLLGALIALAFGVNAYDIGTGLIAVAAVPATLFLIRYVRVRWWATIEGRHLLVFTFAIDLILIEELVARLTDRSSWHHGFIAVMLLVIGALLWQRYTMLVLAQRENRRQEGLLDTQSEVR